MKDKFREFYSPSDEMISDYWDTAIFSFDANILLNLYRYTEETREDILSVFNHLREGNRLWLPYQVGLEYHMNRLQVIAAQENAYEKLSKQLENKLREIEGLLGEFQKHPFIDPEEIMDKLRPTFDELISESKELEEDHPDFEDDDPILESITMIFDGFVGDSPDDDLLKQIYKDGKERYEKKIPPGYRDANKKKEIGDRSLYGDVIVWRELIAHFKGNDLKLIFVTDDVKEDWWEIFEGKTQGPRPELLREFLKETNKEILIYKPQRFLELSAERFNLNVGNEAIGEVKEVRNADEKDWLGYVPISAYHNTLLASNPYSSFHATLSGSLLREIARANPKIEEQYNKVATQLGLPKLDDPINQFMGTYNPYTASFLNYPLHSVDHFRPLDTALSKKEDTPKVNENMKELQPDVAKSEEGQDGE